MRQRQRFQVKGALNSTIADPLADPVKFRILKNVLADRRLGALLKRPGSLTETPAASLGRPLGMGQWMGEASSSLLPVTRKLLVNFAGTAFKKYASGSWSGVTIDSNTSFSGTKPTQFAQMGTQLFIAGGLPARWNGVDDIERVGIPAPDGTITTGTSGVGITATVGWTYMFTFYNSTSGQESDWSPISASTGAVANKTVDLTIPTTSPLADADKKRIYRTFDGGTEYYLLTTIAVATGSYADTTADASLGAASAQDGEFGVPPTTSYVVEAFNNRIWWVDGSNPYRLAYSKPYLGSNINLDYYPDENEQFFDDPITGLIKLPGMMLVAHPRSFSYVTGFTDSDLTFMPYISGVGTLFASSLATNGREIICLSEEGWVDISGGRKRIISSEIDEELRSVMAEQYSDFIYASAVWNPALREFICMVSALSNTSSIWVDSATSAIAEWTDSSTLLPAEWETSFGAGENLFRIKIWGWSPEISSPQDNWWVEYEFAQFKDSNSTNAYPIWLFHPMPSSDTLDPQQDTLYIGYHNGTEGKLLKALKKDYVKDDSTGVISEFLTDRIAVGKQDGGFKRITHLQLEGSYTDLLADSQTFKYLKDANDPQRGDYLTDLKDFAGSGDMKAFTDSKMRWFHLYGKDTSEDIDKIILQNFNVFFRDTFSRESR